jgi:hypothetical protein
MCLTPCFLIPCLSLFSQCATQLPCPTKLAAMCLDLVTIRIAEEGEPGWLRLLESGLFKTVEGVS